MAEVAAAGKEHGDVVLIAGHDGFIISLGSARLNDGGHACGSGGVWAVAEREEGVRGHHCTLGSLAGLLHGNPYRV